jgi:hypothetical protein
MIETMQGKIASLCAETREVKRDQVQVCSIRLEVIAGVGVQFIGSQDLFAPDACITGNSYILCTDFTHTSTKAQDWFIYHLQRQRLQ